MPGFDFSNYNRNAALHARGAPLPKATSTGTTIVGCIYDNGVVVCLYSDGAVFFRLWLPSHVALGLTVVLIQIAADTRATSGPIVADKVRAYYGVYY